jgi:hypothetical protein
MTWVSAATVFLGVIVCIGGLVICALFLRLGLVRRDWALIMGALISTVSLVYAVFWLRDAF